MANASTTGFGLRMVMNVGNTPATSGQSEYKIQTAPGVASNKGDPMSVQSSNGDQGYIQDAAFTVLMMVEQAETRGPTMVVAVADNLTVCA